jgi:hypothetical protein
MTSDTHTLTWLPHGDITKLVAAWRGLIYAGVITDQGSGLTELIDRLASAQAVGVVERQE